MELSALNDAELVDLARGGSAPAFAVLLHRHGPVVRATVANDPDPTGAVIGTYLQAMKRLDEQPAGGTSVRSWLVGLASDEVRDPVAVGDERLPELDPDERDEIWAELDLRWPDGRVRRHVPGWAGWTALVVALVALGVLVPYAAVTWGAEQDDDEREWDVLRAEPFQHDELDREEAPELVEEDDAHFELPTFEFDEPESEPVVTEPEPEPDPDPEPPPEPTDPEEEAADPDEGETDGEVDGDDTEGDDPPDEGADDGEGDDGDDGDDEGDDDGTGDDSSDDGDDEGQGEGDP